MLEVTFPPTLDRPFGVYLYGLFDALTNGWATRFQFAQDSGIPFSSRWEVAAAIVTYYVVIFGGREVLKSAPVIRLNFLFQVHNLILTLLSLGLLLLLVEQLIPIIVRHGVLYAICDAGSWTQPIVTVYYLNYLTKYYELLDTVFLVLRKKPLTFLHTYHHGATALLCFTQLIGHTSVSWVPIVLNLFVHVIMYYYYFLSALGVRNIWWKEWVTRTQIIQFVVDLVFVYFATYTYFTNKYWPWLPNKGTCAGEEFAAIYGCALLTSYLFLFIAFYIRVYTKAKAKGRKRAASAAAKATTGVVTTDRPSTPIAATNGASTGAAGATGSVKSRSRKA
uniref:Elongation of fatty acids protein n=1 Tax=Blastobotrys adeninivorans TaxID=409370 RepID=A0A060T138_BLAAD